MVSDWCVGYKNEGSSLESCSAPVTIRRDGLFKFVGYHLSMDLCSHEPENEVQWSLQQKLHLKWISHCVFPVWHSLPSMAFCIIMLDLLLVGKRPEKTVLFRFLLLIVLRIVLFTCSYAITISIWVGEGEKTLAITMVCVSPNNSNQQNLITKYLIS